MKAKEKIYTGPYKVVKVMRISRRRKVLKRGLTEEEARQKVRQYPSSSRSMVVYFKQFSSDKYFK